MKFLTSILLIIVVFATVGLAKTSDSSLRVLSTKRSVLDIKTSKDLIGATIVIENEEHDVIESIPLEKRRTIVDFFFLAPGAYTVKIQKGEKEIVIHYVNK
jgi:hypothetical protein